MHLRYQTGQLLLDFATNRSGFVLANFPLSAERDALPDSPPTAPSPPDQALTTLLRRELPGFLESQAPK
jgi:hypothetical protein